MNLIYSFYIQQTEELINLCKVSNNLYNQALYLFRQALKNEVNGYGMQIWTS